MVDQPPGPPQEGIANEVIRGNLLAYSQQQAAQTNEVNRASQGIKKPGFFGYFLLFSVAVFLDLVSILGDILDVTGVGFVIVTVIKICIGGLFVWVGYAVNGKIKNMRRASDVIGERAAQIASRVVQLRAYYARAIRLARKSTVLRKPVRRLALSARRITRTTRNPAVKNLWANIAELIPLLDLLPWYLIGVYFMYRDHVATYRESLEHMAEYEEAAEAEAEEFNETQIQLYEDLLGKAT